MKLQGHAFAGFLKNPDPRIRAVLVYGPDRGLVRERTESVCRTVVADLGDPFRLAELTGPSLDRDPARLADEVAAMALTGGRRVVRLRAATNKLAAVLRDCLESALGDTLVVVEAENLTPRDSLRAFFEGADYAATVPCYPDDDETIERVIQSALRAAGLDAEPDALAYVIENLGGDRQVTRRELEKLVQYMASNGPTVSLEDARAVIGDGSAVELDDIAFACADGELAELERGLTRRFLAGDGPVQALRAVGRHFQRLHLVSAQYDAGGSVEAVIGRLRPPVFFKRKAAFARQIRVWTTANLASAIDRLLEAEIQCKSTGMPDQAICRRTLLSLAGVASRRRRAV